MLNLQICTVIIRTKNIKKINNNNNNNKSCDSRDSNPGYMGSKSNKISTTLRRPMQFSDKIINICLSYN